ncbi:hemolysin family protein [Candidatus Neptunichlamydia sp. REUL1]|uniref:hemolysin family protein n=1 Tax=Candidatus Neptunichlamydia sp. REUL1 TaxID=3064277 RepID=UPI0029309092|nr:hemolysin family protein [Candidatus Neptunochlamydia sp. REUL1]
MTLPTLIVILVVLIFTSGFLSASETALFSLSSMKVRAFRLGEDPRGRLIARLLSEPRKLLVTILMLNVVMNILVQNVVSGIFGTFTSWPLTVGVPLALTLIFGEVIPKSIAYPKNTWIAYRVSPIIRGVEVFLKPLRDAITFITTGISKFFFFYLRKESDIEIEELKIALRSSQQTGAVSSEEAKLVRGYLNLEEDLVKELMCPRSEVLFFNINDPLSALIHLFVDEECTCIPVCNGSIENVLGIMTSGSFFLHRNHLKSSHDIIPFLRKPNYVPESMLSRALLEHFYKLQETMVMVVDEYGSVSGLITLEDLVETVIGQIADRRDEKSHYTRASSDIIIASGKLELLEFEEIFDYHLESPNNMATIGGWLTEQLGDIPKSGTKIERHGFLFHVLASDNNRVRRVYIRHLKPAKRKKDG